MPGATPQTVAALGGRLLTGNDWERQEAARQLQALGPTGQSALPALAMALAQRSGAGDPSYRDTLARAVVSVCGGPDKTGPALVRLFANVDARIRVGAAGSLGFLTNFVSSGLPGDNAPLQQGFGEAIPILCEHAARDASPEVRGQCLVSLLRLTYGTQNAPWERGVGFLADALGSATVGERQIAAHVLSLFPVSLWSIYARLRPHLHDPDKATRLYTRAALYHVALTDRVRLTDSLLADLRAGGKRARTASADILTLARTLWSGVYRTQDESFSDTERRGGDWTPRDARVASFDQARFDQAEAQNTRLLGGIAAALTLPDRTVRVTLARALAIIAEGTDGLLGHGSRFQTAGARLPGLLPVLDIAAHAVRADDTELARRLILVRKNLVQPHGTA